MEIKYNSSMCLGCANCVDACPVGVWEVQNGTAVPVKPEACVLCRACVFDCPARCIIME